MAIKVKDAGVKEAYKGESVDEVVDTDKVVILNKSKLKLSKNDLLDKCYDLTLKLADIVDYLQNYYDKQPLPKTILNDDTPSLDKTEYQHNRKKGIFYKEV